MQALAWHHHPLAHACGCRQQLQHRAAPQPLPSLPPAVCPRSRHRTSSRRRQQQQQHPQLPLVAAAGAGSGSSAAGGQEQQQQQQQQRRGLFSQQQPRDGDAPAAADEGEDEALDDEGEWDEGEGEWDEDEDEFEDEFEDEEEGAEDDGADAGATPGVAVIPPGQTSVPFTPDDFVEVGRISRPHGIRGEVKVQLITDEPKKRLGTRGRRLWLKPLPASSGLVAPAAAAAGGGADGRLLKRVVVESGRVARLGGKGQRAEWAVKFEGVSTREQAATLAGNLLLLALCDREARPRGKDEFFVDQLVGLKAVDAGSGALLGVVTEVYESGSSYSLLRLRLAPDEADIAGSTFRSLLLPFVAQMVPAVDVAGGSMQVDLPEGMLETAGKPKQLKRRYTPEQQAQLRQQLATRLAQQAAWEEQQQQREKQ